MGDGGKKGKGRFQMNDQQLAEHYRKIGKPNPYAVAGDTPAKKKAKASTPAAPAGGSRYTAPKPERVDGKYFPSKLEASYYRQLMLRWRSSNDPLSFFLRQVPFDLVGDTKAVLDFLEFEGVEVNGETLYRVTVTDAKGHETDMFKLKQKQVEEIYPLTINLVRKVRR